MRRSLLLVPLAGLLTMGVPAALDAQDLPDRARRAPAAGRVPVNRVPLPSGDTALKRLDDCAAVRGYMVEVIIETLIQQLYWDWWHNPPYSGGAEDDGGAGPSDFTTTNVQEEGVDELDIVKTDGDYLYITQNQEFAIVKTWPPAASHLASMMEMENRPHGLFLFDDQAVVFSESHGGFGFAPEYYRGGTRIDVLDIADRSDPKIERTIELEGYLVDARLIDGHAYVVIQSHLEIPQDAWDLIWSPYYLSYLDLPELDSNASEEEREAAAREARIILEPYIEAIVARLEMRDLVPMVRDTSNGSGVDLKPLFACRDLYRPTEVSEYSMLGVIHLDLTTPQTTPGRLDAVGLLADGWTVYASADNLYVAQSSRWWGWGRPDRDLTTAIHKFELDPGQKKPIRYAASGEVTGWLHNQFSMSEFEGHLRVATTEFDWWWGGVDVESDSGSIVTVLADDRRGRLIERGKIDGIAPGERIYACRFMGDKGYLVTFVQVDPLFTLDLSNPAEPQVIGELEVSGYSAYLHPMENDHLLAVGMDADEEGRVLGLAISIFDVRDFSNPRLAHRFIVEDETDSWSWSEALDDHHAFTFHRGILSIPAYLYGEGKEFSGLLVMAADSERGLWELGRVDHTNLPADPWSSSPWMRRSVYIEEWLYSLSSRGVKVNLLTSPDFELAKIPFYQEPVDGETISTNIATND